MLIMANKSPKRILIAEDDFLVSKGVACLLKDKGYIVVGTAPDGVQAVAMTMEKRPDAVLMDIQMPNQNGIEAARQIQATCPTPIIILTAHDAQDILEQAASTGIGAYLIKPPKSDEIDRAIMVATARHTDLMALRRMKEILEIKKSALEKALGEVKTLRGFIPICASCKNIKDDQGYWHRVEEYVRDHTDADFSHGLCPDCVKKLYPELDIKK